VPIEKSMWENSSFRSQLLEACAQRSTHRQNQQDENQVLLQGSVVDINLMLFGSSS
jgi:hypothetical protein